MIGKYVHFKYNTRHQDFSQPYIVEDVMTLGSDSFLRIKEIDKVVLYTKNNKITFC